jgi:hypothetical protein
VAFLEQRIVNRFLRCGRALHDVQMVSLDGGQAWSDTVVTKRLAFLRPEQPAPEGAC